MKIRIAFLTAIIALALTACKHETITPSQNRVGYSAWRTQVSYTHCDPLPKTGKPEFVSGTWEMSDGILPVACCLATPHCGFTTLSPSDTPFSGRCIAGGRSSWCMLTDGYCRGGW